MGKFLQEGLKWLRDAVGTIAVGKGIEEGVEFVNDKIESPPEEPATPEPPAVEPASTPSEVVAPEAPVVPEWWPSPVTVTPDQEPNFTPLPQDDDSVGMFSPLPLDDSYEMNSSYAGDYDDFGGDE